MSHTGKVFCKNCDHEWGITVIYQEATFIVLKIAGFVLISPYDNRRVVKKWKQAPFSVEPISPEDVSDCLKRQVEIFSQNITDASADIKPINQD